MKAIALSFEDCREMVDACRENHVVFMAGGVIVEEGAPEQIFGAPKDRQTQEFLSRFMHG